MHPLSKQALEDVVIEDVSGKLYQRIPLTKMCGNCRRGMHKRCSGRRWLRGFGTVKCECICVENFGEKTS